MKHISLEDRLRYRFDNIMSKGTGALIVWLALLTVIVVAILTVLALVTGNGVPLEEGGTQNVFQTAWVSLMHTIDAGTLGADPTSNPVFLLLMIVATIAGIFIVSILIGILTSGIEARLEDLRKGRSFVVEQGHTIILGYAPEIFAVLSELVIANENQRDACIVILADKDKVEMEDEIANRIGDTKTTRIVVRSGSPFDMNDLQIVNPDEARAIIILGEGEADEPDIQVIKCILALTNNAHRTRHDYHIVAEIRDAENIAVARMIAPNEVLILAVNELIARVAVQTSLQSGLSVVYQELLDYQGSEIYFQHEPQLIGKSYSESLLAYEHCSVMGIRRQDGTVLLNPPMTTVYEKGDQVIAIAEDDDQIVPNQNNAYAIQNALITLATPQARAVQSVLMLGWNQRGTTMIQQLDEYVPSGSRVLVVSDVDDLAAMIAEECPNLKHLTVTTQTASITNRRMLNDLLRDDFDHIITLSYMDTLETQEADAKTLVALLHLRDIGEKTQRKFSIVSEMLDVRNRQLAEIARADDFIVSNTIISLLVSQVAQNRDLMRVFDDLFDPEGAEIYLKPVSDTVKTGVSVAYHTLVDASRQKGETVIGYRLASDATNPDKQYGVHINPAKSSTVTFSEGDKVIVISDEG